jgi:hypothetical protein
MTRSCHSEGVGCPPRHSGGVDRLGARGVRRPVLAALLTVAASLAASSDLRLELEQASAVVHPLQSVTVTAPGPGSVSVLDGLGREYVRVPATGRVAFAAGGAAGAQSVRLVDPSGKIAGSAAFRLEARTGIEDAGGRMKDLLRLARKTLERPNDSGTPTGVATLEWRGKSYAYYVPWLRDHVHTMKGFKYFDGSGAGAVDFFRETQREDGMIWDFFSRGQEPSFYQTAYGPLGYARRYDSVEMVRMPAEADVEYLFVEGVYFAWKSTADDSWMGRQLDAAVRALDYSFADRARFSTKYGLVKRGYTIDTWDFQIDDPTTRIFPRWGTLLVDPDRSKFGVMFGDNTGYAAACGYLAEMLERAGRPAEAARFRQRERDVRDRLDRVAWLGTHFRHWVPEDGTVVRDVGVDEREQVSLSNTYSLNRGITQEQAAAILRTYQGIRGSLPSGSPGEWYAIYPPFVKGFGDHSEPWQYVNGGVSPIFAGELARGAFIHGFESYGADVLSRVLDLSKSSGDEIRFAYTGAYPPPPEPRFTPVDLSKQANMDLGGKGAPGVPGWMAAMPDDHLGNLPTGRRELAGVPFLVPDPATNGRRGAIAVSRRPGFPEHVLVPVGARAGSIYVLHSVGSAGNLKVAGAITFVYEDGTEATQYAVQDRNVSGWWYPSLEASWPGGYGSPRHPPLVKLAWRGRSDVCPNVGIYWYGLDNPHPDRRVQAIAFTAALDGAIYAVAGLTLADQPLYQKPPAVSFGGPDNWAAGAVVYGLVEGLAGVVDRDVAYRVAGVSPRWPAAGTNEAKVVVHYPASDGYLAYDYRHDPAQREIALTVTGSGERAECHVLLPAGTTAATAVGDGSKAVAFTTSRIEASAYADFTLELPGPRTVRVRY